MISTLGSHYTMRKKNKIIIKVSGIQVMEKINLKSISIYNSYNPPSLKFIIFKGDSRHVSYFKIFGALCNALKHLP